MPISFGAAAFGKWFRLYSVATIVVFAVFGTLTGLDGPKVAANLQRKCVEIFLPTLQEVHRWSDRQKKISTPLFSGYVFARLQPSPSTRLHVLQTEGVIGFVGIRCNASAIPEKQIKDLQQLLSQRVPCSLHAFLRTGQRVRIRGGCLDGFEGILERTGEKLVISIETVERAVAIEIRGYELEPV